MFGNLKNLICLPVVLYLAAFGVDAIGQDKKPPKFPKTKSFAPMPGNEPPGFFSPDGFTSERSIAVDPNVAIKLCVSEGDLKVNGWRRDEVRVFVKNGRKLKLKPLEKSVKTGKVEWLWVGGQTVEPTGRPTDDCLAGETIEIDAPIGTTLDLSGTEVRTTVDSVKKVNVSVVAGAITLRGISGGISAQTGRGDLMVENSAGSIALVGTTGNIVISEVTPGQIGDMLKAKTHSGAITLQRVDHRQIQASSISGSLLFDGKFLSGGIYSFRTSNGSIRLLIPTHSSCTFTATYGAGNFNSEIPLKTLTENITPRAKYVVSRLGTGDANVSLTTSSGVISVHKQTGKP